MAARYVLSRASNNQYWFVLKGGNNETLLTSETYISKSSALNGIESVKINAPLDARYERKNAANGSPMFNLKAGNGQVIGTSQLYASVDAREAGIEAVKREAPGAGTEDKS